MQTPKIVWSAVTDDFGDVWIVTRLYSLVDDGKIVAVAPCYPSTSKTKG